MKCNTILRLVAHSTCASQKLLELQIAARELGNYQENTSSILNLSAGRKIKTSSLGVIDDKNWILPSLFFCKNR
jgi:hypothetical protein